MVGKFITPLSMIHMSEISTSIRKDKRQNEVCDINFDISASLKHKSRSIS
jgi:hypothetical protein